MVFTDREAKLLVSRCIYQLTPVPRKALQPLQEIQNKFLRTATGAPRLHRQHRCAQRHRIAELNQAFQRDIPKTFRQRKISPDLTNPQVEAAADYSPHPIPDTIMRRPRYVLMDSEDPIIGQRNTRPHNSTSHYYIRSTAPMSPITSTPA